MTDEVVNAFWRGFLNPPVESRPRVWWHWMNGNVNIEGLKKDLDWLHKVGIGGVQIFEGGMGAPQAVDERLVWRTEKWYDAFVAAVTEAKAKNMEVAVASSGGWSILGAPWVKPQDAMKKFVWSETVLDDTKALKPLPDVDGNFQDTTTWGHEPKWKFGETVAVFAVPNTETFTKLRPSEIKVSREFEGDTESLFDDSFASWISTQRDVTRQDEIHIEFVYAEPTSVGSAQIGIAGPTGFGAPEMADAQLEYSQDGKSFIPLSHFSMTTSMGQMGEVTARSASFTPVTARYFRLVLTGKSIDDALPPMMPGVRPLPFRPKDFDKFMLSEFALYSGGRVHAGEAKAAFGTAAEYFPLNKKYEATAAIQSDQIIEVTAHLSGDTLNWDAPGEWRIIRVGYSLTGHENGPAPIEATGLEVDKLDAKRISTYLDQYFTPLFEELDKRNIDRSVIGALLSDSIESRAQNFTESLFEEFEKRRGYSMRNWLPAITGWVIDDEEKTDKFLYDYRRTLTELVSDCAYKLIKEFAHKNKARYYSEALESHRPQLGDDLTMRSHADVPMGAMWCWLEGEQPQQTYIADLKGAASVSHVYGKTHTGCESFSTFGKPFIWSPQELKKVADLELTLGVTLFNIHSSPHQPEGVAKPGITLAPTLGQWFTRNETWADQAEPWINYISRTSHILNQGKPVADILYFTGCESPVTGIWGDEPFDIPAGYDFDLVSVDGLLNQIKVENGKLVSAQGTYKVLYLGGNSELLTVEVLRKLKQLQNAGALIHGKQPISTPSLSDSPEEFQKLVSEITFDNLFATDGIDPDWNFSTDLRCIHRKTETADIYFIANPKNESIKFDASFSAKGSNMFIVDAVTLKTRANFELAPYGSCFVIFTDEAIPFESATEPFEALEIEKWVVNVAGAEFESGGTFDLALNTEEAIRYHSGTFTAKATIPKAMTLELPDFGYVATVKINGQDAGVIWAKGQSLDISHLATQPENELELTLSSGWRNRLTGDEHGKASTQAKTYLAYPIFEESAVPSSAGLFKPALLKT